MKKIKIYVDGDSEIYYINKLRAYFGERFGIDGRKIQFDKPEKKTGGVNKGLINKAIECIDNESRDFVFFVTDREENNERIEALNEAKKYLKNQKEKYKSRIKILVSNPTFEMWLYLHFKECSLKNFTQTQLIENLSHITNNKYKKADENWLNKNIFDKEEDLVEKAKNNAKACKDKNKSDQDKEYQYSESEMFELIDYIKNSK